jgi:hypothetical protein
VEGILAAQVQEAPIPDHLVLLATGDDRAQVVVDALARHALEPLERAHVTLENDSIVMSKLKKAVCAPE